MWRTLFSYVAIACLTCALLVGTARAEAPAPLPRDQIAPLIVPPYALGEALGNNGVYQLLNSGGAEIGYVFETGPLAPLPGFSGAPINMLILLDAHGTLIDVRLLSQREPVFVSGLGETPFREFLAQYPGLSITQSLVVGVPYGKGGGGSDLVYLDGVTKATASVRIAHESILAAALTVARDKIQGIGQSAPAQPDPAYNEALTWDDLTKQGIARNLRVTNAEVDQAFAGTIWADDDPEARDDPDGLFLDLWVVDIGPSAIARAVLSPGTYDELQRFLVVSPEAEPILVFDMGRHGLVSEDFVRNTEPDRISAEQGGFPVALRDADLWVELADGMPEPVNAMVLRADRRLGFDPLTDWTLRLQAVRAHGMFQPELGDTHFTIDYVAPDRFYLRPEVHKPLPAWLEAAYNRKADLVVLALGLATLLILLGPAMSRFAGLRHFTPIRLTILAGVIGFVGWWGQGQLSIVTVLATLRAAVGDGSFAVLLYDPFSLVIWAVSIVGFVLWGRGLFCGWLCPFGAMQEFTHHLGRLLRLPQIDPSPKWDRRLKWLKYVALVGLIAIAFLAPDHAEKAAEIEPFKTAITVWFVREWYYVAYAAFWLLLGMVLFKGFCRYLCPLGAVMAIGGLLRGRDWIKRRAECGSPCQLCKVKCRYGSIRKTGEIQYSECFQCLDCVTIHDNPKLCVPLILAARKQERGA
ncbi:4Fe-4S binding protein [Pseudoprimorskyibacter insulae]|uniref:Electron transport protein YccM n=1 Tax=Pseudoprimorskyibacter insulae TaxID=1695997 RepID=A0A2R8B0P5_9RHOB|nr:4Fe-4S binding protein [Pseudoprimorskyibacter insulae]SPF81704.1 Putative electron transport protein YccM [Pseudoprimorskyibacter insulae]